MRDENFFLHFSIFFIILYNIPFTLKIYYPKPMLDRGSNAWRESLHRKRNAPKMAILNRKSKIFIKAKVISMKSCLLGQVSFMIQCILNNFIFSNAIFRVKGMLYSIVKQIEKCKKNFFFTMSFFTNRVWNNEIV